MAMDPIMSRNALECWLYDAIALRGAPIAEKTMQRLLIPVDGSASSKHAVERAGAIAKANPQTKLLLLNVQQNLERRYVHGLRSQSARKHLAEQGERQTAGERALLDRYGCGYEFMIAFGHPAEVIARIASDKHCSAIIMGSRCLGPLKRKIFGSVGEAVQRLADVPVTLVT